MGANSNPLNLLDGFKGPLRGGGKRGGKKEGGEKEGSKRTEGTGEDTPSPK